jgi:predicted nucleic acid-binding protein
VALAVLDASVLIAFRDPADALHNRAVAAFRTYGSEELILPASVYAEVLVGPVRVGAPAVASLDQFIGDFGMHIAPLTPEVARFAASLRAAIPSLRLPDAFVLATGEALDAAIVLSADGAWPKVSARVRLI